MQGWEGGHLELAQHRITALPQVGQVQAPLIILEPLEQESVTGTSQGLGLTHNDPKGQSARPDLP